MYINISFKKKMLIAVVVVLILAIIATTITLCFGITRQTSAPQPKPTEFVFGSQIGHNGRLGNQLFQVASVIGVAKQFSLQSAINWPKSEELFEYTFADIAEEQSSTTLINEKNAFDFEDIQLPPEGGNLDIAGYRQHVSYFNHAIPDIRRYFEIKKDLIKHTQNKIPELLHPKCICVHVRRGDFVNNKVHEVCDMEYYLFGIKFFRALYPDAPVVVVTDSAIWTQHCLVNIAKVPNVIVLPGSDVEDFTCLYLAPIKIISNSTFAWWATWLDARWNTQVLAPSPWIHMEGQWKSLYSPHWFVYDCSLKKLIQVPHKANIPLGGYYQCYKEPCAFVNACESFRRVYPDTSLVVVNDAGDNFEACSKYYRANYSVNLQRGGNGMTTLLCSIEKIQTYIFNLMEGAKKIQQDFFVLLEDDVHIFRALQMNSENILFDLIGNNASSALFNEATIQLLGKYNIRAGWYGGCGGSLFRTKFWSGLDSEIVKNQLHEFAQVNNVFHSDVVLSYLCLRNNGRMTCAQSMFPSEFSEKKLQMGCSTTPAILHQFKDFYSHDLLEHEKNKLQ